MSISLKCRLCGALNEVIGGENIFPLEEVHCSHCREPLGEWGELSVDPATRSSPRRRRSPPRKCSTPTTPTD